jgi:glycosyltransferase involved in cell wall biosynthesis
MKILQIINSLETAGAEKLLLDTVPLYVKKGIKMDVLLLWDNDFPFTDSLRKLGCCNIYILKKSENRKDVYNPSAVLGIKKILSNYDIAHLHVFPSQYFAVFANLLNKGKTKLVLTEHNTSNSRIKNKIFKPVEHFVYNRYDKVICITDEIKNIYLDYLGLPDKLVTINNGVDIRRINSSQAYTKSDLGYREDEKLLIMVARFEDQKDQDTLIRALLNLPEKYKLLLVGIGKRRKELENLVLKLNLSERVRFLGQRMDVYQLIKTADFVVLSSHFEGLSLASVEGLASGKPFIASDVPGLKEIVKDAGLLFKKGDDRQLADLILSFENNQERYDDVVAGCLERADKYDISDMVNKYIELYHSVLGNNFVNSQKS